MNNTTKSNNKLTERQLQAEKMLRWVRLKLTQETDLEKKAYGLTSLNFKFVCMESVETIGVYGLKLYYNSDFILGASVDFRNAKLKSLEIVKLLAGQDAYDKEVARFDAIYSKKDIEFIKFLFKHEIDHTIYEHFVRIGTRDKDLWNKACDHRINLDAANKWFGGVDKMALKYPVINHFCFNKKYEDPEWLSEMIYEDLQKEQEKNNGNNNKNGSSGSGETVDQHIYKNPEDGSSSNQDNSYESQMASSKLKDAFIEAAKQIGLNRNCALLEKIQGSKPKINWKKFLRNNLSGLNINMHDPKKISRRVIALTNYLHEKSQLDSSMHLYAAGKKPAPMVKCYCLFDTSGSIGDKERAIMLGETLNIFKMYQNFQVEVSCWDTNHIKNSIKEFNPSNKNEAKNYEFLGGGGTNIHCVLEYLDSLKLTKLDKVVVFTDGYYGNMDKEFNKYKNNLIFVLTEPNMEKVVKYGKAVSYDKYI